MRDTIVYTESYPFGVSESYLRDRPDAVSYGDDTASDTDMRDRSESVSDGDYAAANTDM